MMYLENSEKSKVSGEGEPSTEVMLAEQCQLLPKTEAADLTSSSKGSAELDMEVLVEYTDQTVDPSCTFCNEHTEYFEQYSASDGFSDSDHIVDKCETSGLSQPFDECAQHRECFKPCESPEHCANHSLASKCSPCCEHCAEHLQLFQQCKPSDQQLDFDSDELAVNCDGFGQCEMSDFIPECTEDLELLQQYELPDQQPECFDSEPDASTEDSEQCEMAPFTPNISDSEDLLDCGTALCDENLNQTDDEDDESYPSEREDENETELIYEESGLPEDVNSSRFGAPVHVYFDDSDDVFFGSECCETHQHADMSTDQCEMCEDDYCDDSQQQDSDKTSEFFPEDDGASDCSSIETKSFKTCPDGSLPSLPCSDSSGESEKGTQEDSSDEQTQWESFEDDEEMEQSNINETNEDKKKKSAVNFVIEDYFDLFDRSDYYGHAYAQKQRYISCFDGGDIDVRLHLDEVHSKVTKNAIKRKEVNEEIQEQETETCFDASEEVPEDTSNEEDASPRDDISSGSCESERQPEDWTVESESSLAEDEVEECESEELYSENCEEAEEDEDTCAFDNRVSEICDEEDDEVCLPSGNRENMFAPCADDISVEGDAYEDELSDAQNNESLGDETSTIKTVFDDNKEDESEDKEFIDCSEMEPYWSLVDQEEDEELCEPGVEEYYAYQMKSVQSSSDEQALNGLYDQIIRGRPDGNDSGTDSQTSPEECKTDRFEITPVIQLSDNLADCSTDVEKTTSEEAPESDDDSGFSEISRDLKPPLDIIHSVASEESGDSEEEPSDDESSEPCECDYCIPPIEQVLYDFAPQLRDLNKCSDKTLNDCVRGKSVNTAGLFIHSLRLYQHLSGADCAVSVSNSSSSAIIITRLFSTRANTCIGVTGSLSGSCQLVFSIRFTLANTDLRPLVEGWDTVR